MDSQKIYDDFITKYPIYQDNRVFKILINKFKEIFIKDIYDDIPKIFKQLYENNEIPSDVYDYFLIDIGVSEDLIKELSNQEKLIFIKSLSDFQKYKSTVGLVKNIVQAYGDSVEVYELYIDYDTVHSVWECKPYLIYKPAFSADSYSKAIPYKTVYEKIPSLLIHEKQLDQMRASNIGIFPIKTNIIFLNSNYNQSITSYLQNLITSVFCNTYAEAEINLYFTNVLIPCTLYQFILLWLYLIFIGNNNNIDSKLNGLYICFDNNTDVTIDELESIILEYESIGQVPESLDINTLSTRSCGYNEIKISELDNFYNKYIKSNKTQLSKSENKLDKIKIKSILINNNKKLMDYIDNEININNTDQSFIFNVLINSLQIYQKTSASLDFIKYFKYFKSFLPSIDILPLQNTMYKILYYTKPFHTEILNYVDVSLITSQDVFNNIYFTHFYKSNLFFTQSDSIVLECFQNIVSLKPILENITLISVLSKQFVTLQLSESIDFQEAIIENTPKLQFSEDLDIQEDFTQLYIYENLNDFLIGYGLGYGSGYGSGLPVGFYW